VPARGARLLRQGRGGNTDPARVVVPGEMDAGYYTIEPVLIYNTDGF
jgi:hypothetical protein